MEICCATMIMAEGGRMCCRLPSSSPQQPLNCLVSSGSMIACKDQKSFLSARCMSCEFRVTCALLPFCRLLPLKGFGLLKMRPENGKPEKKRWGRAGREVKCRKNIGVSGERALKEYRSIRRKNAERYPKEIGQEGADKPSPVRSF